MGRIVGAVIRGLFVLLIVALPAFILPQSGRSTQEISMIIGALVAVFAVMEYGSSHPGVIDFRFAPPYNRLRFTAVTVVMLFMIPLTANGVAGFDKAYPELARAVDAMSSIMHFPFSPCAAASALILPDSFNAEQSAMFERACGISMFFTTVFIGLYVLLIWVLRWPVRRDEFNLWVNLPTFEPTAGRDIAWRLRRTGALSLLVGIAAPYIVVLLASRTGGWFEPQALSNPLTMIWASVFWMIIPVTLIGRGLAMTKIATLIERARGN